MRDLKSLDIRSFSRQLEEREEVLKQTEIPSETMIKEGDLITEVLRCIRNNDIDVVFGTPGVFDTTHRVKLARKAPCSVFLMQEKAELNFQKILMPFDFSEYSALQIHNCNLIADSKSNVFLFHATKEASNYLRMTYHTLDEVNNHLEKRAVINAKLNDFSAVKLEEYSSEIETGSFLAPVSIMVENENKIAEAICQECLSKDIDLVIIGSKGKSSSITSLLGTTTETVCRDLLTSSVLVVKKKDENKGIINALLSLARIN